MQHNGKPPSGHWRPGQDQSAPGEKSLIHLKKQMKQVCMQTWNYKKILNYAQ